MQTIRTLTLGLVVGLSLSFVSSCGPAPKECGPSTCMGCCDENGECLAGSGQLACGLGGGACAVCEANQACLGGACGLIDGGDYDASFPDRPDASINYDAGVYDGGPDAGPPDAGPVDAGMADAGRPDSGVMDSGVPDAGPRMDAGTSDAGSSDAGTPDAGPPDSGTQVSFAADIQPILTNRCQPCHTWSYASTVNVMTSCGGMGSVYVSPNSLDNSRLYGKVAGVPACGSPMPLGLPPLPQAELDLIRDWILQGARNN
jgi:hypothetical protein